MAEIKIPCIRIKQWSSLWNEVKFNETTKKKPREDFFMFSISAKLLGDLSTVDARKTTGRQNGEADLGSQRLLEEGRAKKIGSYIKFGYPYSDLSEKQMGDEKYNTLRNPGWLPTSIVANIIPNIQGLELHEDEGSPFLLIDQEKVRDIFPIEIIDGQHRLAAFQDDEIPDIELPVVAFYNLAKSWQAYLFWNINIRPKKINPSLAFDLYPLLRNMDWLEQGDETRAFRQTRSQELVETLFLHPSSPWKDKINMLGEPGFFYPTQAGWIRALERSYLGLRNGVFSMGDEYGEMFQWNRETQKFFLIYLWANFQDAVNNSQINDAWWQDDTGNADPFFSKKCLISTEQGIVAIMSVTNAILQKNPDLSFGNKSLLDNELTNMDDLIVRTFWDNTNGDRFIKELVQIIASFDWRTADNFSDENQRLLRLGFRGSSGYVLFKEYLLKHIQSRTARGSLLNNIVESLLADRHDI